MALKERPILFSGAMVRAILDGRKTQTRRVISVSPSVTGKPEPARDLERCGSGWHWVRSDGQCEWHIGCPYGAPGGKLWVRETWYDDHLLRERDETPTKPDEYIYYRADGEARDQFEQLDPPNARIWRPSIHMPRWASRITLEITGVRVERLHEITEADAKAEGIDPHDWFPDYADSVPQCDRGGPEHPARYGFRILWNELNGKRAPWSSNPWVWALDFRRLES